jgi:hypothetical protein
MTRIDEADAPATPASTIPPDGGRPPFTLDAAFIARTFGLTPARLRALMALGMFRSLVEAGEAEDAGTWRLTLRCGNRVWRGVVDSDGALSRQSIGVTRTPPLRRDGR